MVLKKEERLTLYRLTLDYLLATHDPSTKVLRGLCNIFIHLDTTGFCDILYTECNNIDNFLQNFPEIYSQIPPSRFGQTFKWGTDEERITVLRQAIKILEN